MVLHWMTSCIIQDPTEFVWKGLSLKCVLRFGTQWKFIQSYMYIYVRKSIILASWCGILLYIHRVIWIVLRKKTSENIWYSKYWSVLLEDGKIQKKIFGNVDDEIYIWIEFKRNNILSYWNYRMFEILMCSEDKKN